MVGNQLVQDVEPTPEFNKAGLDLIHQWEQGDLSFTDIIQSLNQLLTHARKNRHSANEARAHHLLGYVQHYHGNLSTSIMHYEKSRRLFKRLGNLNRVSIVDLNQGENYRLRGEFSRARRFYQAAYEGARTHKNESIMAMAIANEGLTLLNLEDYSGARHALHEGYSLLTKLPDPPANLPEMLAEIHHALATIELDTGDVAAAWDHARETLHFAELSQNAFMHGFAFRVMGDVRTHPHVPDDPQFKQSPDEFYMASIQTFKDMGLDGEIARTYFARAGSLAKRGKKRAAAQLYREAMVIFSRLGMAHDAARAADAQLKVL